MAKKPTLSDISNVPTSAPTINSNNQKIEDAFENTLSLDGSTPNAMLADLDMNSNDILNVGNISVQTITIAGDNLQTLAEEIADNAAAAALSETNAALSETNAAADAAYVATIADEFPDPKGSWLTATVYEKGDIITINGGSQICLIPHTSGTYATDKSNGKWQTLADQGASGGGTGDMLAAQNLNDVADKPTSRANLGLGSLATQAAGAVAITGGTVVGITDLAVADGGTGASDAATARTNLGAQTLDATLTSLSGISLVAGDILYATAADTLVRLAKGATGQFLKMNAGATAPEWGNSNSRVLLATKTASASATLNFTEFDNATYKWYEFELEDVLPATDTATLRMRFSTDAGDNL